MDKSRSMRTLCDVTVLLKRQKERQPIFIYFISIPVKVSAVIITIINKVVWKKPPIVYLTLIFVLVIHLPDFLFTYLTLVNIPTVGHAGHGSLPEYQKGVGHTLRAKSRLVDICKTSYRSYSQSNQTALKASDKQQLPSCDNNHSKIQIRDFRIGEICLHWYVSEPFSVL